MDWSNWISLLSTLLLILQSGNVNSSYTRRKIYTLFTTPKTWNEAKDICNSQFGQLLKYKGERSLSELRYVSDHVEEWESNQVAEIWTGLHYPNPTMSGLEFLYQDCTKAAADVVIMNSTSTYCTEINFGSSSLHPAIPEDCSEQQPFICERDADDCWYEPHVGKRLLVGTYINMTTLTGVDATECALSCRNDSYTTQECWAFLYVTNSATSTCHLQYADSSDPEQSVNWLLSTSWGDTGSDDVTLYVKRCFEGVVDLDSYSDISNTNVEPETSCPNTGLDIPEEADGNVCFCTSESQPPIPSTQTIEEQVEELIKELTIDTKNTSSAQRKLTSAEDDRTSAKSVGYLGVAMLVTVFGGLLVLDFDVLYKHVMQFMNNDGD